MKYEEARIHFLSDVFVIFAVVVAFKSSLLARQRSTSPCDAFCMRAPVMCSLALCTKFKGARSGYLLSL